jgi:hypothetical protein
MHQASKERYRCRSAPPVYWPSIFKTFLAAGRGRVGRVSGVVLGSEQGTGLRLRSGLTAVPLSEPQGERSGSSHCCSTSSRSGLTAVGQGARRATTREGGARPRGRSPISEATGPYLEPLPDLFLAPTAHRLGSGSRWRDALSGFPVLSRQVWVRHPGTISGTKQDSRQHVTATDTMPCEQGPDADMVSGFGRVITLPAEEGPDTCINTGDSQSDHFDSTSHSPGTPFAVPYNCRGSWPTSAVLPCNGAHRCELSAFEVPAKSHGSPFADHFVCTWRTKPSINGSSSLSGRVPIICGTRGSSA